MHQNWAPELLQRRKDKWFCNFSEMYSFSSSGACGEFLVFSGKIRWHFQPQPHGYFITIVATCWPSKRQKSVFLRPEHLYTWTTSYPQENTGNTGLKILYIGVKGHRVVSASEAIFPLSPEQWYMRWCPATSLNHRAPIPPIQPPTNPPTPPHPPTHPLNPSEHGQIVLLSVQ